MAAIVPAVAAFAHFSGAIRPADDWLSSLRMEAAQRQPVGNLVLVDIDSRSIAALKSWPWPRRVHAELIDRLMALDAAEIAFDIDFSATSSIEDDALLEAALERAGGSVILAAFSQQATADGADGASTNVPIEPFARNAWIASVNLRSDRDGIVRRYPYAHEIAGELVPSMPVYLSGAISRGTETFAIDFSINSEAIERVSVIDVLEDRIDRDRIAGKTVIVGAQAMELRDFFTVPGGRTVSGALLQALATETLLQGRALVETGKVVDIVGLALLVVILFAIMRLDWRLRLAALAATTVTIEAAATVTQMVHPLSIHTATWHLAVLGFAFITLILEIDVRRLMQLISLVRARNAETMLERVIHDSFNGILVMDDQRVIRAASRSAGEILCIGKALVGRSVDSCLPVELVREIDAALGARFRPGEEDVAEVLIDDDRRRTRVLEFVVTLSEQDDLETGGNILTCVTFTDVTEKRNAAARIERMARFDSLTGLPNRNQFIERLNVAAANAASGTISCAVVCFDLDNFKAINDTLGHGVGDKLLAKVAERAASLLPPNGLVARLGGDEFAVVIEDEIAGVLVRDYVSRLILRMAEPFETGDHRIVVAASAGVTVVETAVSTADAIIREADVALYRAKDGGGNRWVTFDPDMLTAIARRQRLEMDLLRAMNDNQLEVWYQPKVDLRTGAIRGAEALLRWRHPERGLVSPAEFIPVAESIGLIERLGSWVLETACRDATDWPEHVRIAVNVSAEQFARGDMIEVVATALTRSALPASRLEIEITESLFVRSPETVKQVLEKLRDRGVTIALDDFGTGYSSLSYLHHFPVDKIKIDRSFVCRLGDDGDSGLAIIRAIAALSTHLGMTLTAEGIETPAQEKALALVGIDEGQGYLFARPQPKTDIDALMLAGAAIPPHDERTARTASISMLYG